MASFSPLLRTGTFTTLLIALTASIIHPISAQGGPPPGGATIRGGESLRFGCSQLVIERSDPIVSPGLVPSPHTHQIVGGNAFNFSMDPADVDPAAASTCTSCTYSEDFSNYWTATVYFRSPENGTYKLVPQMANFNSFDGSRFLEQRGGLTVYYMQPFGVLNGGDLKITGFKPVSSFCFAFFVSFGFVFCLLPLRFLSPLAQSCYWSRIGVVVVFGPVWALTLVFNSTKPPSLHLSPPLSLYPFSFSACI